MQRHIFPLRLSSTGCFFRLVIATAQAGEGGSAIGKALSKLGGKAWDSLKTRAREHLREMAGDPATEFGFVEAVLEFLGSVFAIHLMEMDESPVTDHAMQIIYDEFKSSKNVMGAAVEVANYIRENS